MFDLFFVFRKYCKDHSYHLGFSEIFYNLSDSTLSYSNVLLLLLMFPGGGAADSDCDGKEGG
jgi:hypothetical protein